MTATAPPAQIDKATVKRAAGGRWPEILSHLAGIPSESLDPTREHPCPLCGGDTRFRLIDEAAGACRCSHCCPDKCGDGLAAVQHFAGCTFPEALSKVADYLGVGASSNGKPTRRKAKTKTSQGKKPARIRSPQDVLVEVCRLKRMPVASAVAYGAVAKKWGCDWVVEFPVYGPDGKQCGTFGIPLDGSKGKFARGSHHGLFLPHDDDGNVILPKPKKSWKLVEGVKDAAALHGLGYLAAGLPTSAMNEKFSTLFRGVDVIVVPDPDKAGQEGADKTIDNLAGVAKSIRRATLVGGDVRDVLAQDRGEEALRQAIIDAVEVHAEEATLCEKFTFAELATQYPKLNPPVLDGLLRAGETANLISVSKIGKSWLAYNLAISVATGRTWLDRFPTTKGKVLLIDNELQRSTLAHRIPKVGDAMEIFQSEYHDNLDIWPLRGKLKSLKDLMADFETVERGCYQLILMDAKYRFATDGASENDNAAEAMFYNLVDRIAEMTNAANLLIHHSSKGSQSDKRVTDVGSGAGAQSRAADCHIILREHEEDDCVVLDAAVRSYPPVESMVLRWNFPLWTADLEADPRNLKRQQSNQEKRDDEGTEIIVEILKSGPLTIRKLRKEAGFGKDRVEKLVFRMIREGKIEKISTRINGNECEEFNLRNDEF